MTAATKGIRWRLIAIVLVTFTFGFIVYEWDQAQLADAESRYSLVYKQLQEATAELQMGAKLDEQLTEANVLLKVNAFRTEQDARATELRFGEWDARRHGLATTALSVDASRTFAQSVVGDPGAILLFLDEFTRAPLPIDVTKAVITATLDHKTQLSLAGHILGGPR